MLDNPHAGGHRRFHGGAPPLQFWQAMDTALNRQVALTFVDPDGSLPDTDHDADALAYVARAY